VSPGVTYDTYYIKFNEYDRSVYQWGDYIQEDSTVIIAVQAGSGEATSVDAILSAGLGSPVDQGAVCLTTTSTTTTVWPSTSTTTTLIP